MQLICNEYHTRIPWHLEDWEEPSLLLPPYDPKAPPVKEDLSPEKEVLKANHINILNMVSQSTAHHLRDVTLIAFFSAFDGG